MVVISAADYNVYSEYVFRRVLPSLPGDVRPTLGARVKGFAQPPSAEELRRLILHGRAIAEEV